MKLVRTAGLVLLGCLLTAAGPPAADDSATGAPEAAASADAGKPVPADTAARAREALAPLKQNLMKALTGAMTEGGPVEAIRVCRVKAPLIASGSSTEDVQVGRTSHRVRNLENAPAPWMEPLLLQYEEHPEDPSPRTVRIDAEHVGYVEPIFVKPLCLKCHGDTIDEALQTKLLELYPEDRAVGFGDGDFRGMFWVRLRDGA